MDHMGETNVAETHIQVHGQKYALLINKLKSRPYQPATSLHPKKIVQKWLSSTKSKFALTIRSNLLKSQTTGAETDDRSRIKHLMLEHLQLGEGVMRHPNTWIPIQERTNCNQLQLTHAQLLHHPHVSQGIPNILPVWSCTFN